MKRNSKTFIKILIIGIMTVLIGVLSFFLFRKFIFTANRQLSTQLSNLCSWIITTCVAYIAYKKTTYQNNKDSLMTQLIKYFTFSTTLLFLEISLLFIFTYIFSIKPIIIKTVSQIITATITTIIITIKASKNEYPKISFSFLCITFLLLVLLFSITLNYKLIAEKRHKTEGTIENRLENIDISNINKLMIVAHPDDETYWGGSHILNDDYFIVCITCGTVEERVNEFKKAMEVTGDSYIMLGYPDKTNGKKDEWKNGIQASIYRDLDYIINYKKWDIIVTHNPEGEYGHIHHKMTSKIVTSIADANILTYFGKYYVKDKLKNVSLKKIDADDYKIKLDITENIYKSQKTAYGYFNHMFEYENWVNAKDWIYEK